MNEEIFRKNVKEALGIKEKASNLLMDFLKHQVIVSSTLLAVLVALHKPTEKNSLIFLTIVCILLVSILSGSLAIYIAVMQLRTLSKDYMQQIKDNLRNPNFSIKGLGSRYNKRAVFLEIIAIASFFIAIILLALYSFI